MNDIEALVAKCRKLGIVHYKDSAVEFTLGPAPVETQTEVVDTADDSANVKPKLGADGLDAEGQFALYDRVIDAEG